MNTDWRKNLLSLPWVKPVKGEVRCEGIKWGAVALRDIYSHGPNRSIPPRGIQERAKCKRQAKVVFKATKRLRKWDAPATSGAYCYEHAAMQITNYDAEARRSNAFLNKNGWWRNGVFGFHKNEEEQA